MFVSFFTLLFVFYRPISSCSPNHKRTEGNCRAIITRHLNLFRITSFAYNSYEKKKCAASFILFLIAPFEGTFFPEIQKILPHCIRSKDPFLYAVRKSAAPYRIATPCCVTKGILGVQKAVFGPNSPLFPSLYPLCSVGTIIALGFSEAGHEYLA